MKPGLFVTGTGTEVGKTRVAAAIVRALVAAGHRVGVYKPVASGCRAEAGRIVCDDAVALWEAAGRPEDIEHVCPQQFRAPLAPHLAARNEGRQVDSERLREGLAWWRARSEVVVIEGSGGLLSPLTADEYNADLALEFGYPLVVVAADELGTINHTMQTLIAAATFREGVPIAGVVLCQVRDPAGDPSTATNAEELAARCVPPLLAKVPWQSHDLDRPVDWYQLACLQL